VTTAPSHAPSALPRLVFFMNPSGAPCQLQDRVLREMGAELNGRAVLVYYRTTEPADLAQFGRYGIRSLPMLVVTDAEGREVRRATPGIHSADEIRQLLAP
jgi:thioredoxin 1